MHFNNEYELQIDLAEHLRNVGYLTYTEIELKSKSGGRADVVAIKPSYANKDCRIYEVKNNRMCFENDLKYEKYFEVCHRMYIACPAGMITKDELPKKVGLITRNENGWHVVKAAKRNNPTDFNMNFVLSLLYRGYEETREQRDLRERIIAKENTSLKDQAYYIGFEIGRRLDRDRETQVEEWANKVNELFLEYLNVGMSARKKLPEIWELEYLLKSVSGTLKEVNNIKKIGEYLRNMDLPELKEGYGNCLKQLREEIPMFRKVVAK